MTEPTPSEPKEVSFANYVLGDWDNAMEEFFHAVERKMTARGLTVKEVETALIEGYGYEVGEAWIAYMEEDEG